MEQIGYDFECQQSVERCSNTNVAKKEDQNIFEELMQFCDVSIDENLNEVRNSFFSKFRKLKIIIKIKAIHSRVEDDAVAFLLAHIGAENMVSSINDKSPVPFKELNWNNLDRFRRKTQPEPTKSSEIKQTILRRALPRSASVPKRDPLSNFNEATAESDASDTDFDPESDDFAPAKERLKLRSKPRPQPIEPPKIKIKIAKPKKIHAKRGRKSKGGAEPTSSSTINIDQEGQWINKTNTIWHCLFHKAGGRVYGSGVSLAPTSLSNE